MSTSLDPERVQARLEQARRATRELLDLVRGFEIALSAYEGEIARLEVELELLGADDEDEE